VWVISHKKPAAFFDKFERKGGDVDNTAYCPGCGHGVLHKLIAEAIDELGIKDRAIFVNPVGCSVFVHAYFDSGNVLASHGRAPAVATGIKRMLPHAIVICYQGDGDLAAIGGNEIIQAANRGENITVFFVNNGIYGMTGGQMAPTTPLGGKTTTSQTGRRSNVEGFPVRMCEILGTMEAPVYVERVALTDPKNHMKARKAVRRALQNQVEDRGFSFVEVLSACPTGWHVTPREAITWVEKNMVTAFPLGVFKDRKADAGAAAAPKFAAHELGSEIPEAELAPAGLLGALARGEIPELSMKISGFGGQGVLFSGIALAEAGMREGLQVSWIPSYGPEMRGGTAHCHVRISKEQIASPLINRPSTVIAFNEPSVQKFGAELIPGGLLMLNSSMIKTIPDRSDIKIVSVPATEAANSIGNAKVANMVLLGAYLEVTQALNPESIISALAEHGLRQDIVQLNRLALQTGQKLISA
jgi:2-oxoisovalerate ferredoxin oxidoreductase beta subunit